MTTINTSRLTIIIKGGIGSGKTTAAHILKLHLEKEFGWKCSLQKEDAREGSEVECLRRARTMKRRVSIKTEREI